EEQTVMRHIKRSAPFRAITLLICALFILNAAAVGKAQSGRRIPKRPASAEPMPPKASEPPVVQPEATTSAKTAIPIMLAKHLNDIVFSSDIYLNDVMNGF